MFLHLRLNRLVIIVCLLLLSGCSVFSSGNAQRSSTGTDPSFAIQNTWNNIHTFLTFDSTVVNPAGVSNRYDFVWGAEVNHVPELMRGNPAIFLTYYMAFHRDMGTFTQDGGVGRLTYWQASHPDWILYKCDRITPAYEFTDPSVPLDFSNPAVISWQVQTYAQPASLLGYRGIAADNVNLKNLFGACGFYRGGTWVQRYTGQIDDSQWSEDVLHWLGRMRQALHHLAHPLALIPNLTVSALGRLTSDNPLIQRILNNVDGVVDEGGFTDYGQGYLSDDDWLARVQFIRYVQQHNKPYYIINVFPGVDHAAFQWALASYLEAKEQACALYISVVNKYGTDAWHKEYYTQIGSPADTMYLTQHVYVRDYTHGISIVNSSASNSYTFTLNAFRRYSDLDGHSIGPVIEMAPHSGIVLLLTT